jgi:hypothetical protein
MSLQRLTCADVTQEALTHVCDPCGRELGRVRGVILFEGSYDVQALIEKIKSGGDEAKTDVLTAIEGGQAHLISETTGTFDGGAPQTGDGYGDEETRLLGYLYTLAFKDPSYAPNTEFWEKAENNHWLVAWRTETKLHFTDKPATLQAIAPVEQDLTSAVAWNVTATWKSKKKPVVVDLEPLAELFEGCWGEQPGE